MENMLAFTGKEGTEPAGEQPLNEEKLGGT